MEMFCKGEETMRLRLKISFGIGAAALGLSGCAHDAYGPHGYDPTFGDYAYEGSDWRSAGGPSRGSLRGPGVEMLDPWLIGTQEGREIVTLGFRDAGDGFVDEDTAHRANIWFRRYADTNRDLCLTDPEIRVALVQASRVQGWNRGS